MLSQRGPLSTDSESLGLPVTSTDVWAPSRFIPSESPGVGHRNCSEEETDAPSDVNAKGGLSAAARAAVFKDGPRQAAAHLAPVRNARQQPRARPPAPQTVRWGPAVRPSEAPGGLGAASLQTMSLNKGLPGQIPARSFTSQVTLRWWWRFSRPVVSDSRNAMNCSPPGSSVHGILQARILEWAAVSFFM